MCNSIVEYFCSLCYIKCEEMFHDDDIHDGMEYLIMNSLGAKTFTMVLLIEKWDVLTMLIISRSVLWMMIALSENR
jgi:hypothetical protein